MPNILYISYDGMTDPLGQSQVMPYVFGLRKKGYRFTLLSCEKPHRLKKHGKNIAEQFKEHDVEWVYLPYTAKPPILAKYADIYRLKRTALQLHRQRQFAMTHCRSYVSAEIGLMLKRRHGVKFMFDMRGFWVNERVDGGLWNLKNPIYRMAYHRYKQKETAYLKNADAVIILTQAGKTEMLKWKVFSQNQNPPPVGVIPCSADFELFKPPRDEIKKHARQLWEIDGNQLAVSYMGSIGTWYMLDEMLAFFTQLKQSHPNAVMLFLTPEPPESILPKLGKHNLQNRDVRIRFAARREVPVYMAASNFSLFFIKPSYSKISSSPTKLGEILAMGIPVVCNAGVGDVEKIVHQTKGGFIINDFNAPAYQKIIAQLPDLLKHDPAEIRRLAFEYYDLNKAVERYTEWYQKVLKKEKGL